MAPTARRFMFPTFVFALLVHADPVRAYQARGSAAYGDSAAAVVVARARDRRRLVDRSITRYRTLSRERVSVGVRTVGREHLAARKEVQVRVDWQRDGPLRVEAVAAREVSPLADQGERVGGLSDLWLPAFDPAEERLNLNFLDTVFVYHPLAELSEAHYRFHSGDTTTVALGDGRTVHVLSLDVEPRVQDVHHLIGTLWLDADSYALVRATFRLAGDVRLVRYDSSVVLDFSRNAAQRQEHWLPPFLKQIRGEVAWFTLEYGLWEGRWWMPRRIAMEAHVSMGRFVEVPIRYERTYAEYEIEGDTAWVPVVRTPTAGAERDSIAVACRAREGCVCWAGGCRDVEVVVPRDTASLLVSPRLEGSIWDEGWVFEGVTTPEVLVGELPKPPWQIGDLRAAWGLGGAGLVRYNRVEGLSVGVRTGLDLGRATLEGTARLGLADFQPGLEVALVQDGGLGELRLEGYRRLAAMNPVDRPLGIGNSLGALFGGRDDGEYFRAVGLEVVRRPAASESGPRTEWRLWGERQRAVSRGADFTVKRFWGDDSGFRPVLTADPADQLGASVRVRRDFGIGSVGWWWGMEVAAEGSAGTYDFGRAAVVLRTRVPLPGRFGGFIEVESGTSVGALPSQSGWFLGGPATVRGYEGAAVRGEAFWRGRLEVETERPGARLSLFGDAGWAGDRHAWSGRPGLVSAGMGVTFLDGLIRIDLARALRSPTGWRMDLALSGR